MVVSLFWWNKYSYVIHTGLYASLLWINFITILVLVTEHSGFVCKRSSVFGDTYSVNELRLRIFAFSVRFLNNILNDKLILGQVQYDEYVKSTTYAFFHCGTSAGYQVTHFTVDVWSAVAKCHHGAVKLPTLHVFNFISNLGISDCRKHLNICHLWENAFV